MDDVWNREDEVAVRDVMEDAQPPGEEATCLHDVHDDPRPASRKGAVERRREGKTDFYRSTYTREEYADLRAQAGVTRSSNSTATPPSAISPVRWRA